MCRYPFDSEKAQFLNKQIFETIYYGAMEASCELAKELGPYETYEGCPVSKGVSDNHWLCWQGTDEWCGIPVLSCIMKEISFVTSVICHSNLLNS